MIYLEELTGVTKLYNEMTFTPLKITAEMISPIVDYGPVYLDSLLGRVVVDEATHGNGVQDNPDAYWIPVPVKLACMSPYPLWFSSALYAAGESVRDTVFLQKTVQSGEWTSAKNIQTKTGRWMERRIPTPLKTTAELEARCIGNKAEVERLLDKIQFIGKRRSIGYGEVKTWRVEPADYSEKDIFVSGSLLIRALPVENIGIECDETPAYVGWTPPQWKASLYTPGWRIGTQTKIDWFDGL